MAIQDLFDGKEKKKRLSHIRNLIALAHVDGKFTKSEMDLILSIGIKIGLTRNELTRIIDRPDSVNYYPPVTFKERIQQVYDMVLIMMVDRELHREEREFCKTLASRLGFREKIVDKMIIDILKSIEGGTEATDEALDLLSKMYED